MKQSLIIFFTFLLSIQLSAQGKDPAATTILNKIETKFPKTKILESEFTFKVQYPETEPQVFKGNMVQQGDKYYVKTEDYTFLSDGKASYVINTPNKEVYINSINANDELESPGEILTFYHKAEYDYMLVDENQESPENNLLEFKPLSKESPYFKVKLFVDKQNVPKVYQLFQKDGSRYILEITRLKIAENTDPKLFIFDKSKYNGYHIEDLRID